MLWVAPLPGGDSRLQKWRKAPGSENGALPSGDGQLFHAPADLNSPP